MKKTFFILLGALFTLAVSAQNIPTAKTNYGILAGSYESGIAVFKGIPFAQPPVANLRWRAPQAMKVWTGVRQATKYGDDPMQGNPFGDMGFNAEKKSEDCLYLNIWTPAKTMKESLPVVIYFNGGGLIAGSGSEPRYAGASLARHGIIVITANYREGIFGFFAHPELSKETVHHSSGNYGFMDQAAAIKWVYDNIAAFGGDPKQITIAGESAGSMSVSALMTTDLTKGMISKGIASSGSVCGRPFISQKQAEELGVKKLTSMHVKNIKEARQMSAEELLEKSEMNGLPSYCIDGYMFTESPDVIYRKGNQQKIPLLVGRNSMEMPAQYVLQGKPATLETMRAIIEEQYGNKAQEIMEIYGLKTDKDVLGKPGVDFASDSFIAYGTWLFGYLHAKTSGQPVYRYYFSHPRPEMVQKGLVAGLAGGVSKRDKDETSTLTEGFKGAVHSADIEYAMGTLPTNRVYNWQPEDYAVSEQFIRYYANFIKTGNPNGLGLADWDPINGKQLPSQLILDVNSHQECDAAFENRNLFLMNIGK